MPRHEVAAGPERSPRPSRCFHCGEPLETRERDDDGIPECEGCRRERRSDARRSTLRRALGGVAGATVGAGIWAAIAITTRREIGFIASLLGFLAGVGVRLANDEARPDGAWRAAVVSTIFGVALAKLGVFAWFYLAGGNETSASGFGAALRDAAPHMTGPYDLLWIALGLVAASRACRPSLW